MAEPKKYNTTGCFRICKYYKEEKGMERWMYCNHPIWTKEQRRKTSNCIIDHDNSHDGKFPDLCPLKLK